MKKIIRNFIIKIIILTVIIAFIGGVIFYFVFSSAYFQTFPLLLILFPVTSSVIHIRLLKASQKSLAKFNVAFMLGFMLKLVIYATFTGIIVSADSENKNVFVITLLLMYLIYTIFDTKSALSDIKKLSEYEEKTKNE